MEKLKLDINVGGNLQGLEQLINKMKEAEAQMARLAELGNEDKLTSLISGIFGANIGGIGGAAGGFIGGPIGAVIGSTVQKVVGTVGDLIIGTAKGLGSIALDFGKKVVDSAAYRQNSITALSKLTGSDASASREFNIATRIADKTIFDTKDIVDLTKRLFISGFKSNEVDTLRGRGLDIASLYGDEGKEVLKEYTAAINKIAGKGKYTAEIEQGDLIEKRLGVKSVRLGIAEQLGLKGDEKSLLNQVAKLIKAGKVDEATAINAVNEAIAKKTGGGVAGAFSREAATRSISGALSNLQDVFSNTLLRIDWDKSPGIMAFKKFVLNLSDALGSNEFKRIITDLSETLFGGFDKIDKNDIVNWVDKFKSAILALKPAITETWDAIIGIIKGDKSLISGLLSGFANVSATIGKFLVAGVQDALVGGDHINDVLAEYREKQLRVEEAKRAEKIYQQQKAKQEKLEKDRKAKQSYKAMGFDDYFNDGAVVNNTYNIQVDGTGNKDAGKQVIAAVKNEGLASGRAGK